MTTIPSLSGPSLKPGSGSVPDSLVVLVHGFGSNGADMIALAPQWRHALPGALFVAPNGPEICHGAPGGYQWWGLHDLSRPSLAAGALRAAPVLNRFIDSFLEEHRLTADRLLLVGFSQGTMLSLHVAPRRTRQIAGVVGYSGMLPDPSTATRDIATKPPILLVHGDRDDVIPLVAHHEAVHVLKQRGFPLTSHVSSGVGHSVDPLGLQLGVRFARERLHAAD